MAGSGFEFSPDGLALAGALNASVGGERVDQAHPIAGRSDPAVPDRRPGAAGVAHRQTDGSSVWVDLYRKRGSGVANRSRQLAHHKPCVLQQRGRMAHRWSTSQTNWRAAAGAPCSAAKSAVILGPAQESRRRPPRRPTIELCRWHTSRTLRPAPVPAPTRCDTRTAARTAAHRRGRSTPPRALSLPAHPQPPIGAPPSHRTHRPVFRSRQLGGLPTRRSCGTHRGPPRQRG